MTRWKKWNSEIDTFPGGWTLYKGAAKRGKFAVIDIEGMCQVFASIKDAKDFVKKRIYGGGERANSIDS